MTEKIKQRFIAVLKYLAPTAGTVLTYLTGVGTVNIPGVPAGVDSAVFGLITAALTWWTTTYSAHTSEAGIVGAQVVKVMKATGTDVVSAAQTVASKTSDTAPAHSVSAVAQVGDMGDLSRVDLTGEDESNG